MRVLMTGHNGYIGSVMQGVFRAAGHEVIGLDIGYYCETDIYGGKCREKINPTDLRTADLSLKGFDAIVHLAALSNDPIGNLDSKWTREINLEGTLRLAERARRDGVARFLFSSSCIMYGSAEAEDVDETSPLDPRTEYARSKVAAERALSDMASDSFSPVFLRNGTVYGMSPRMRFDTVLNNFVGQALATGVVVVLSNGEPWRPVMHVEDVSRTFLNFLEAPRHLIHNEAYNNGCDELNWQIRDLAKVAGEVVPGSRVEVRAETSADQRTYKASFGKFKKAFPDFTFKWNPRTGAEQLYQGLKAIGLTREIFEKPDFTRLQWLKALLAQKRLDEGLHWIVPPSALSHSEGTPSE